MNDFSITEKIIGEAIFVHKELGPGLLESTCQNCLFPRLKKAGFSVVKESPLPVFFDGIQNDCAYWLDLVVENKVVLELKSVKKMKDIHLAQMVTYLKLGGYSTGLLINFNVLKLVDGIKRVKI